ncbi:MAG TPA: hypothetical protein VKB80_03675 [Kofleriaceae bacterium]|nr:hypothetical protein [Kofleriaceae bacterium]
MILLGLSVLGAAFTVGSVAACGSGPYTGAPDKLKKPRAKKRPLDKPPATEVADADGGKDGKGGKGGKGPKEPAVSDEQCRTNFFAEPKKGPRHSKEARNMAIQTEGTLRDAEAQGGQARQQLVVDAMGTLSNALTKDPYAPEPTYKLAVAYAMIGRKSCSLALLERLKALGGMPDVEKEAARTIQRASRDPVFQPFSKEARAALGL